MLNPEKCTFGVPSGKLLGFLVSSRGIEANPEKIKAIENMKSPTRLKEVQKLTGCMATLSRFVTRMGERGQPFFALLKKQDKFVWTQEAERHSLHSSATYQTPPYLLLPNLMKNYSSILPPRHTPLALSLLSRERKYSDQFITSAKLSMTQRQDIHIFKNCSTQSS